MMANNRVKSGILIMGRSKPLPVITDPVEARQAIVKDVLQRASQARSHFHVAPVSERTWNGIVFASRHEMKNHIALTEQERMGLISDLRRQVPFEMYVNGQLITRYIADHCYYDKTLQREIVADSKGKRTALFVVKAKLMRAIFGIDIIEM